MENKEMEQQLPTVTKKGTLVSKQVQMLSDEIINDSLIRQMIHDAMQMTKRSYSPYSNFKVGAALLTSKKKIYTGCNIENATFTPTNCAERTAFFKAVSEGEKDFAAIAIVGGREGKITDFCPPCGVCRQVMMEFCNPKKFVVILARSEEDYCAYTLEQLMPLGFTGGNIQ